MRVWRSTRLSCSRRRQNTQAAADLMNHAAYEADLVLLCRRVLRALDAIA